MKRRDLYTFFAIFLVSMLFIPPSMPSMIPNAFTQDVIPDWIKNNAGWWADGQIDDSSFVSSIQWLISNGVMVIPPTEHGPGDGSNVIPDWIKNNAGWWADDKISEVEFINAIQFLIKNGIINIQNSLTEKYNLCNDSNELSTEFKEKIKVEIKEQWNYLCSSFYIDKYTKYDPWPSRGEGAGINEHGFRGPEITKEKPVNTFRIFLVGGSTTFGSGNDDKSQIFSVLQKKIDQKDFGFDIEIINAGISGAWSKDEVRMVKDKLIDFSPDLIVVYDGVNEISHHQDGSEIDWKDRWSEICNLGKKNGFDTIVILQPFIASSFRVLTENDQEIFLKQGGFDNKIDFYQLYSNQLQEINKNCKNAVDMTHMFNKIPGDLFHDSVHTGIRGNQIIADNLYRVISPIIGGMQYFESTGSNMNSKNDVNDLLSLQNLNFNNVNFENLDLSGIDFSGRNLENAIFYDTNLNNVDFTNANLSGANLLGGSVDGANFSGANIKNAKFIKTQLGDSNFTNAILDKTLLYRLDFTNANLSGTSIMDAKILDSSFKGMNLNGIDFTNTVFHKVDLSYANITSLNLAEKDLSHSNLAGVNLRGKNLEGTNLTNVLLTDTNVTDAQLSNAIFAESDTYKPIMIREQYGSIISQQSDGIFERYHFFQWPCSIITCTNEKGERVTDGVMIINEGLKLNDKLQYLYNEIGITTEPQNTVVLFPTISVGAFSKRCVWDYYTIPPLNSPHDCYTMKMANVDFTKPNPSNFDTPYFTEHNCYPITDSRTQKLTGGCDLPLIPFLFYNSSFKGAQALYLLGYTIISDLEIEKNPNILSSYEKIIVLHNKYTTKTIFNAITSHPKVVYLYPDSLKEEVSVNFGQNTVTALNPLKHPQKKNFQNDFQWEYDSSHLEYVNCLDGEVKFEKVANGIMLNCYPEDSLTLSPSLFKIIKEF